jgi:hypothetical protein
MRTVFTLSFFACMFISLTSRSQSAADPGNTARLTKFDGQIAGKTVQLNWNAEEELNVSRYDLQHSTDGLHFETIAIVFAQNSQHNEYVYPERHPVKGMNYYRLMIVDNDNRINYSGTISFRFNKTLLYNKKK